MPVDLPPISKVYQDQMTALSHGLALWDPNPLKEFYNKVSIGDVGYLHEGSFIRMFNVILPWNHYSNRTLGEPEPYRSLDCGRFNKTFKRRFDRVNHYSRHVLAEANTGNGQAMTPDYLEGVTYKFQDCGALLTLPNGGYHEDVIRTQAFEDYIKGHVDSWFTWAQENRLGIEHVEELILVSGCTLVTSWAAAAFMPVGDAMDAEISLMSRTLNNGRASFVWSNIRGRVLYHNSLFEPLLGERNSITTQDQCVFIRGFRVKDDTMQVIRVPYVPEHDDPNVGVVDTIRPPINNEYPQRLPQYPYPSQHIGGSRTGLDTIGSHINHANPQLLPYSSSTALQSNGSVYNASYMTSPSDNSSFKVRNCIGERAQKIRHDDTFAERTTSIPLVDNVESSTVGAENSLHENIPPFLNKNSHMRPVPPRGAPKELNSSFAAATLRESPETNQTTERKKGIFRQEIGSYLFRRLAKAKFAFPILPKPIPSSNRRYPALSITSSHHGGTSSEKHAQATIQRDHKSTSGFKSTSLQPETPYTTKTEQTNYQTSKASLDVSRQKSSIVLSSRGSNERHARATVQHNRGTVTTSTSSFKHRVAMPKSVRFQDWESEQLHRNGTEYAPSFDDKLPLQDPRCQETLPHGTRVPTSGLVNRMNSENFLSKRRADEALEYHPEHLLIRQNQLSNDFRFRILVLGKRDSGKSALIKTIFGVDMSGSPLNISGRTADFRPPDNRNLIVYECSAFGPEEMQIIHRFIIGHNYKGCPDEERLHAIWICVPLSDVIDGQFDEGVKSLLNIGVLLPVILVFTKFDLIVPKVSSNIEGSNDNRQVRAAAYTEHCRKCRTLFGGVPTEIVSSDYSFVCGMSLGEVVSWRALFSAQPSFHNLIDKLVQTMDRLIIAHSQKIILSNEAHWILLSRPRMLHVPHVWSVSQRASCDINILASIELGKRKNWCNFWFGYGFRGQTLASCVEVVHADIVFVWNLLNKDSYLSSKAFREQISYLVQDLSRFPTSAPSRPEMGPAWLANHYEDKKEKICLMMGYIVDLILILCGVFKSPDNVSPGEVQSAINNFAGSSLKSVHNDISSFITTMPKLQYYDNNFVMAKIKELISENCDVRRL